MQDTVAFPSVKPTTAVPADVVAPLSEPSSSTSTPHFPTSAELSASPKRARSPRRTPPKHSTSHLSSPPWTSSALPPTPSGSDVHKLLSPHELTSTSRRRPRSKSSTSGNHRPHSSALRSPNNDPTSKSTSREQNSHPPSPVMSTRSMFSAFPSRPHTLFHLTNFGESFISSSTTAASQSQSPSGSSSSGRTTPEGEGDSGFESHASSKFRIGAVKTSPGAYRFGARGRYDTVPNRKSPLAKEVLSADEAKGVHSPFGEWFGNDAAVLVGKGKGKQRETFPTIREVDGEREDVLTPRRNTFAHHARTYSYTPAVAVDVSAKTTTRQRTGSSASARDILIAVQERFIPPPLPPSRPASPPYSESSASATLLDAESEYDPPIQSPTLISTPTSSLPQPGLIARIRQRAQSLTPSSLWSGGNTSEGASVVESIMASERRPPTPTLIITSPSQPDSIKQPREDSRSPLTIQTTTPSSNSPKHTKSQSQTLARNPPSPLTPMFSIRSPNPTTPLIPTPTGAFPPLHPQLAALEKSSRLLKSTVHCAVCGDVGKDFPRCGRCGEAWCSRVCRVESLRREKEEGRGAGKRHVCRGGTAAGVQMGIA